MKQLAPLVHQKLNECCLPSRTQADRDACILEANQLATGTISALNQANDACERDKLEDMRKLLQAGYELWKPKITKIINGSATTTSFANTFPLLLPDEKIEFGFDASRVDPCGTTTTVVVGNVTVLPSSAGKQVVENASQTSSAVVPSVITEATANQALTSCQYKIANDAQFRFKAIDAPWFSFPASGSVTLVGLGNDTNAPTGSRKALVGAVTIKLSTPRGSIVLKADETNPENSLYVNQTGKGQLALAMSIESEYPFGMGANGSTFWMTFPVNLNAEGSVLRFDTLGEIEGTALVPVTQQLSAGFMREGTIYPALPTRPTDPCATGLGNPTMNDDADWIMQGIYGALDNSCGVHYQ